MSILDTLVTNRTKADYDRVLELSGKGLQGMTAPERLEYLAGMKGAYNAADLNRVTQAMEYVAGRFRECGYSVELAHSKSWTMTDIPAPTEMDGYLSDLSILHDALSAASIPDVPPDMDELTWQEANDIEKILLEVERLLKLAAGYWRRCGNATTYCGQIGLPTEGLALARTWAELDALGWGWPEWDSKTWLQILYEV